MIKGIERWRIVQRRQTPMRKMWKGEPNGRACCGMCKKNGVSLTGLQKGDAPRRPPEFRGHIIAGCFLKIEGQSESPLPGGRNILKINSQICG